MRNIKDKYEKQITIWITKQNSFSIAPIRRVGVIIKGH